MKLYQELAVILGVVLVLIGLWGFDWRVSMIVAGVLFASAGFYGLKNDSRISRTR